jgi:hypothetical protein
MGGGISPSGGQMKAQLIVFKRKFKAPPIVTIVIKLPLSLALNNNILRDMLITLALQGKAALSGKSMLILPKNCSSGCNLRRYYFN